MTSRETLYRIVADITGVKPPVSDTLRLCRDLSIMGDDAHELLARISKEFGTRFDGFDFHTYFPNETEAIYWHIGRWFGCHYPKKEITVGHLGTVIENGRWVDP